MTRAKNGEDAIKYIRGNGKGHNGAAYRNEYFSGINMLPDSVVPFEKQMQIFWDKADRRHTTQVDRYFISYALSELNPDNPEDVLKAHNIGCEIAREIAPGHQAVVATQTDGKGHKIHTHIDVNDVNMETLKGLISTQYMHYKVREIADRVCQKYFDLASPAIAPEKESAAIRGKKYRDAKSKQKTYTWQDDLKERINDAAKGAVDEADFFSRLRDNGVEVEKRKATKTQPEYYLYIMLSFAEFERDMIVSRCQGGRAYKRATDPDYREGRKPGYSKAQLDHAVDLLHDHSFSEVAAMTGMSRSTVTREARKRGFRKSEL